MISTPRYPAELPGQLPCMIFRHISRIGEQILELNAALHGILI
jgi:hypothetical protein